ncbi:MAG: hypothetical protein V2A79_09780 [Planctomycetota bacterium]
MEAFSISCSGDAESVSQALVELADRMFAADKRTGRFAHIPYADSEEFERGYSIGVAAVLTKMVHGQLSFSVGDKSGKR